MVRKQLQDKTLSPPPTHTVAAASFFPYAGSESASTWSPSLRGASRRGEEREETGDVPESCPLPLPAEQNRGGCQAEGSNMSGDETQCSLFTGVFWWCKVNAVMGRKCRTGIAFRCGSTLPASCGISATVVRS